MAGTVIIVTEQGLFESKVDFPRGCWVRVFCLGLESKCGPKDRRCCYGDGPFLGLSEFLPGTYNVGVAHELKYKMNEFVLNFPETLGLKRLSRLEARVFCFSLVFYASGFPGFKNFFYF